MFRRLLRVLHGGIACLIFWLINGISYNKAVLVLADDNAELDRCAIRQLDKYIERKFATKVVIIWHSSRTLAMLEKEKLPAGTKVKHLPLKKINLLYDFYCYHRFFENIVFTFTSSPEVNLLSRVLTETDITENEAVCLALYHLRMVYDVKRGTPHV